METDPVGAYGWRRSFLSFSPRSGSSSLGKSTDYHSHHSFVHDFCLYSQISQPSPNLRIDANVTSSLTGEYRSYLIPNYYVVY